MRIEKKILKYVNDEERALDEEEKRLTDTIRLLSQELTLVQVKIYF